MELISKNDGKKYIDLIGSLNCVSYRVCNYDRGKFEFHLIYPQERQISLRTQPDRSFVLSLDVYRNNKIIMYRHNISVYTQTIILLEFLYALPE